MKDIAQWQRFDDEHSTCAGCAALVHNSELAKGRCNGCREEEKDRRRAQLEKADNRALARAARDFLAAVQGEGKDTKRMSAILDGFFRKQGGAEKFAEQLSDHWDKVQGKNLDESERMDYEYNPKLVLAWAELLMRHQAKDDEQKVTDISNLSQEDLLVALRSLAVEMVTTNPEFRRLAIMESIKVEPDLVNLALESAGMPPPLEGEATASELPRPNSAVPLLRQTITGGGGADDLLDDQEAFIDDGK